MALPGFPRSEPDRNAVSSKKDRKNGGKKSATKNKKEKKGSKSPAPS